MDKDAERVKGPSASCCEDQYSLVLEGINQPVLHISIDGRIIFINRYAAMGLGGKQDDFIGKSLWKLFPDDIADNYSNNIKDVIRRGEKLVVREETVVNGQARWYESSLQPIRNPEGKFDSVLIVAIDVTDLKVMEESLRSSEKQYKTLVEGSNHPIAQIDRDGRFFFVNNYAAEMLGVSAREVSGKTMWDFFPRDAADRQMAAVREVIDTKSKKLVQEETVVRGGNYWFETSLQPLFNDDGSVTSVLMLAMDITDRKIAQDELRNSEALYRTIFENTGTATVIVEEDLTISMVNNKFVEMADCRKDDIEFKRSILEFVDPLYIDKVQEYHRIRLIDPDAVPKMYEFKFKLPSGEVRDAFVTVAIIPGTRRTLASLADVTDIKKKEFEIQKQKEITDNLNLALEHKVRELEDALSHIKKLEGLVPICVGCKKMLSEESDSKDPGSWVPLERYISDRTEASFTHGLCPECVKKMYGNAAKRDNKGA